MVPLWIYPLFLPVMAGFIVWLRTQFRYRITSRHLEILLWGLPVRRVALADIDQVAVRHRIWAEQWWNTWHPNRRRLLIRRRRGWCRHFVITPQRRYEFKAELERAMRGGTGTDDSPACAQSSPDPHPLT